MIRILRPIFTEEHFIIPACDGTETLAMTSGLFSEKEPDFMRANINKPSEATREKVVSMYELVMLTNIKEMFSSLSSNLNHLYLTQAQIASFVRGRQAWLYQYEYATFFLFKVLEQDWVAFIVPSYFKNLFNVRLRSFEDPAVWLGSQVRVVVPQL